MRLRPARLTALATVCLPLLLACPNALAQSDADRATARSLGQDGESALEAKDFKKAEDLFRRADRLVHAPTLSLGLARALAGAGKYVESQETYNRIIREGVFPGAPAPFQRAVDDAKKEVDAVSPKVAGATITVQGPGGAEIANPSVLLDGVAVNAASLGVRRLVDPGSHVLKVSADGYKAQELHFQVNEGGSVTEPVTLEKDASAPPPPTTGTNTTGAATPPPATTTTTSPPPPPAGGGSHSSSVLPIVAFGVGGAGLILGAITGGIALGDHSNLSTECPGGTCSSTQARSDLDGYHTMGLLSTVGFIVAGVGAATGVVLLVTQPKETAGSAGGLHVAPTIGLGSVGAVGTF
jgi:hypothetical protein